MNVIKTPVCIVGAGPAGTTASMFLSKYGIEHVLVERKSLPYDKVCGEGFVGRVVHVLNEIDPNWTTELLQDQVIVKSRVINYFFQPYKKKLRVAFPSTSTPFIKAKRSNFDFALLQKARESSLLTYIDKCNITEFNKNADGVRLSDVKNNTCIEAKLVLICMGENLTSLTKIFPDYKMDGVKYLVLRQYFEQATYEDDDHASEIYCYNKPFIYFIYTTRLPNNQAAIEIFIAKKYALEIDFNLEVNLKNSLVNTERLRKRFENARMVGKSQGCSLLLGTNSRKLSDERFLLAGSSIGSIHNFTGVGVGYAMRSGQLAAYWAAESLKENNYSAAFFKQYDKAILQRFKSDFRLSRLVNSLYPHTKMAFTIAKFGGFARWFQMKILFMFHELTSRQH